MKRARQIVLEEIAELAEDLHFGYKTTLEMMTNKVKLIDDESRLFELLKELKKTPKAIIHEIKKDRKGNR